MTTSPQKWEDIHAPDFLLIGSASLSRRPGNVFVTTGNSYNPVIFNYHTVKLII